MTVRYCDRCGLPLTADARFCASCGAPRAADPSQTGAPPVQPAPPPVSMSAPRVQPAPPPVSMSAPRVQPAPSWPAASPGAPAGWNSTPPPRKRGRGCGCLLVPAVLALAVLAGLGAIGGAFDGAGAGADSGAVGAGEVPPATTPLAGTITPGAAEVIAIQASDPGSDVTLTAPGDGPVPGLRVEIPAGAYPAPVEFALSARPVTVAGYDGKVTALSDLITVENGGAYATSPIIVTIPVTIPDGMFAMGFFRQEDGTLEAMPLVDETPTSVTVATRHFSSFLVLAIAETALPENIGTGFRAHEDDFQAPNYGTYRASSGHCAGQSIAAMWYFLERRSHGAPSLWGLTDNDGRDPTPDFWEDDATQLHLASSVQRDLDWDALLAKLSIWLRRADLDRLQWDAFRYAMLVTGEPQYVGLSQTGLEGGHAIVGYAATPSGLWVADPNFPGKLRHIAWNAGAGRFDPYASGATVRDSSSMYDLVGLMGKTALIDWDAVGARWAEYDAGTVGRDRFPVIEVQLEVTDAAGVKHYEPLRSGPIATNPPRLTFRELKTIPLRATFYAGTQKVDSAVDGYIAIVPLAHGINDIGVLVEGLIGTEWAYLDFYRFELVAPAPSGMPTPAATEPPEPGPTYDCSNKPSGGIGGLDWSLHCESMQPIQR